MDYYKQAKEDELLSEMIMKKMGNVKKLMHINGAFDKSYFQTCKCNCT